MDNINKFLELFNPYPGNTFLEVSSGVDGITDALYDLLNSKQSNLKLAIYSDKDVNIQLKYPNTKIQFIDDMKKPFRASPRSVDIVILKDIYTKHKFGDRLLKLSYTSLANAAQVVIIEPKGNLEKTTICETLERLEFRAANFVDIFADYDVVVAKKMHMWGNGL